MKKIGMIGTNFVSDMFMQGMVDINDAKVTCVVSTSLDKAQEFANKYGIETAIDDYHNLKDVDIVYIATPNALHKEMSEFFLKQNLAVMCEKPMAANIAEVDSMIKTASDNQAFLMENLMPLYNPNLAILKSSLELVGPIRQVNFNFSKYSSRYDAYLAGENPTTFRNELANGAIMDLGVYPIGVCLGVFGKPNDIYATSQLLKSGADVSGMAIFKYDGFDACIQYSKASDTYNRNEICGEKGTIVIEGISLLNKIVFIDRITKEETILATEPKVSMYYSIKETLDTLSNNQRFINKHDAESIKLVHDTITKCRLQSGIKYPQDK
ncbi:MAG: Gfo/Idh/MocA family protein [Erysipelotrichaceae bacterium]